MSPNLSESRLLPDFPTGCFGQTLTYLRTYTSVTQERKDLLLLNRKTAQTRATPHTEIKRGLALTQILCVFLQTLMKP